MSEATAVKKFESESQTKWAVNLADGRTYLATTYPKSNLISIETYNSGRKVSGARISAQVREAIAAAAA